MRLASRYVPTEVLNRPKQGLSSPLPYIMGSAFGAMFGRYLNDSRLVALGLLEQDAIDTLLQEHLSKTEDHANRLWLLLNAEIWYRVKIEEQDTEELSNEMAELLESGSASPSPVL